MEGFLHKLHDEKYNEKALLNFIEDHSPDTIVTIHKAAADAIYKLKIKGGLKTTRVIWIQTDTIQAASPEMYKVFDRTFVFHPKIKSLLAKKGVPLKKLLISGPPLKPYIFNKIDPAEFLLSEGLDPNKDTIVIANGRRIKELKNIIHPFLADYPKGSFQFVLITEDEEEVNKVFKKLEQEFERAIPFVQVFPSERELAVNYLKSSDLFVVRENSSFTIEGIVLRIPTIILEKAEDNSFINFSSFPQIALFNTSIDELSKDINQIFNDQALREEMFQEQSRFRSSLNLSGIVSAILSKSDNKNFFSDLGLIGGTKVTGGRKALRLLERDMEAEVEIILSYASALKNTLVEHFTTNPAGHIAIRIGDTVYSANAYAKRGVEKNLLYTTSLYSYLYGLDQTVKNQQFSSTVGLTYERENLSLRIKGISREAIYKMRLEIDKIQQEWREGKTSYDFTHNNCADFVRRILIAGGYKAKTKFSKIVGQKGYKFFRSSKSKKDN